MVVKILTTTTVDKILIRYCHLWPCYWYNSYSKR